MKLYPHGRRRPLKYLIYLIIIIATAMGLLMLCTGDKVYTERIKVRVTIVTDPSEIIENVKWKTLKNASNPSVSEPKATIGTNANLSKIILENRLQAWKDQSIRQQRELIAYEMKGYNFTGTENNGKKFSTSLENLIMEKGGEPMRSVIFATWRSGSTFMGAFLNSHPGSFYHYEPLLHMEQNQVRSKEEATSALKILSHLLSCNYTDIDEFFKWQQYVIDERNQQNKRVWQFCHQKKKLCEEPNFLSDMCKLFPFQVLKTVRIRLRLAKELLENRRLNNLRILLLVRDPRAVMQSRHHADWCVHGSECIQSEVLCKDMEEDLIYAELFRKQYPDRFLALRYEDISIQPSTAAKTIFNFFHLRVHPDVKSFIQTHTVINHGGAGSTYRDSRTTPFHWIREWYEKGNETAFEAIQRGCSKVMQKWGYAMVSNRSQLLSFDPLKKPPWPEMMIT